MNIRTISVRCWLTAFAALGILSTSLAQTTTQVFELQTFAVQAKSQFEQSQALGIAWAKKHHWPVSTTTKDGTYVIAGMEQGRPIYRMTFNKGGAATIRASDVYPGGAAGMSLTGSGVTLGEWDGGAVFTGHGDFQGRVTQKDGANSVSSHSTHVAGTMMGGGVNANARGMSYEALLWAYDWNSDTGEASNAAASGLRVSSHSYGQVQGWHFGALGDNKWVWFGDADIDPFEDWQFGFYSNTSRQWDSLLYSAPFLQTCVASGNDRDDGPNAGAQHWAWDSATNNWALSTAPRKKNGEPGGYNTLGIGMQSAKNILLVGAINGIPGGYTGTGSVVMSSFSSWGPSDDGRIKPDLVAKGVNVFSVLPGGGYGTMSGTSMATPMVSGATGLLIQQYRLSRGADPRAATLKAVMINTADEAGAFDGPDYACGWGLLNIRAAAEAIAASGSKPDSLVETSINTGQTFTKTFIHPGGRDLKVTIAWTDPAATVSDPSLNPRAKKLVNDLDLRVTQGFTANMPWTLDVENPTSPAIPGDNITDNVEQVAIKNAPAGVYTITVTAKGTLKPSGAQAFSMATSAVGSGSVQLSLNPNNLVGGTATVIGSVTLETAAPAGGTVVQVSSSDVNLAKVPASFTIPEGEVSGTFNVTTLAVLATKQVTITINAGGLGASANITLTPVSVIGISLDKASAIGGENLGGTVELDGPAPTGGAAVQLSSSAPNVARTTRFWVLVPAGRTSTTFLVNTFNLSLGRDVIFRAERGGIFMETTLKVLPVVPMTLALSTAQVKPGATLNGTVTLNGKAPTGGVSVALTTSNSDIATVPATVFIAQGQTTATFAIKAKMVATARTVNILASRAGTSISAGLTVSP